MPYALNPEQGYLVSANHRIVGDEYPHYLSAAWRSGYRAKRIEELLTEKQRVSPADCRHYHMDFNSVPGKLLVTTLKDIQATNTDALLSLNLLREWNGDLNIDSKGGAVYQVLLNKLAKTILEPRLGGELTREVLGLGPDEVLYPINELHGHWVAIISSWLAEENSHWLPNGRESTLLDCLAQTTAELREQLGDDPGRWSWGALHHIRFDHAFAQRPPLDRVFCHGSYAIGGDADTVNQVAVAPGNPSEHIAASYRQIIDLGDLRASVAMFAPGQSGHLGSSHYGDLIRPWFDGEYFPMSWDSKDSAETSRKRLTLLPSL
jgi:penicillin amidase